MRDRVPLPLLLLAVSLPTLASCAPREAAFRDFSGEAMATRWQLVLPDRPGADAAAKAVFDRLVALDLELSEWKEGSPLSAVNRAAGVAPVEVPAELFALLERSLEIGRKTDGAFDISWAALWGTWDFRKQPPSLPDAAVVAAKVKLVDWSKIELDPGKRAVFLPEAGMKLGLGGIGKGYALDRAAEMLEARGFHDFMIVGGGQVVARGARGDRAWRVGVRDPRGGPEDYFARVELKNASISTSADNESFFEIEGVRYHHILDPRTGWPSRGLRSATVVHADATLADALSTAVMVLGRDRGLEIARAFGADALLVDGHGAVAVSPGAEARFEILRPPAAAPR